ncbi:hypothetical protein H0H93_007134 [Arthromyces matolae]|nr:hypothetical protein H0H93_007134 [Arthromyces matolae]
MGINGLWNVVMDSRTQVSLLDLCTQEMLSRKRSHSRPFIIGVDFNNLFDKCAFGARKQSIHGPLGPNPELRIFFNRLCEFLIVGPGAVFVFVSDGDKKSKVKRGKKVKTTQLWYLQHVRTLVNAFGYRYHQAPGEAEAELARLNSEGLIDAIITDDSDSLVFGAKRVIRRVDKDNINNYYVYDAENIRTARQLSHEDLIVFALLAGGDYHSAVSGCGQKTSQALAQHEFHLGEKLIHARRTLDDKDFSANFLPALRANVRNLHNAGRLSLEDFPDCNALNLYAFPITSWTNGSSNPVDTSRWIHREPNIRDLARFCSEYFEWPELKLRSTFRTKLWRGCQTNLSLVSQKYKVYDDDSKKLSTPNVSTTIISVKHQELDSDGTSHSSALDSVTISTSGFVAAMQSGDATKGRNMKVDVPENLLPPFSLPSLPLPSIPKPMIPQLVPSSSNQNGTNSHTVAQFTASPIDRHEHEPQASTSSTLNAQPSQRFIDLTSQPEDLGVIDLTQPEDLGVIDLTQPEDLGVIDITLQEPIDDLGEIFLRLQEPSSSKGKRKITAQSDDSPPPAKRRVISDHES